MDIMTFIFGTAQISAGHFFESPRAAFAHMVDRICGRGTWVQNPWVFRDDLKLLNKPVKVDKYVV